MNWGHKITLVYSSFVLFIAAMITICVKQKDIFLVSPDYYKEEIAYQQQMDRIANAKRLPIEFSYASQQGEVHIALSNAHSDAKGEILFFRPADAAQDVSVPLQLSQEGKQRISVAQLARGLWKVKIHWTVAGQEYFSEQILVI
jgi:hypothetical protein